MRLNEFNCTRAIPYALTHLMAPTSFLDLLTNTHMGNYKTSKMAAIRRFVLGVDLDGVCADFYRGLRPIAAEWLGVDVATLPERVSWGLPEWGIDKAPGGYEALHRFAVTQRDLFRILPPMPGAPAALRQLSAADVRIRVITHRFFIKFFHQVAAR